MSSKRLTRRRFVVASAASLGMLGAAGVRVDAASAPGNGFAPGNGLMFGRFVRAQGARAAVVSINGGGTVSATLDPGAFVVHGADGIVDSLSAFVPGELVVVRGDRTGDDLAAVELQSVYTKVSGVYARDDAGHWLVTPSGKRVRVPQDVMQRDAASGITPGETRTATIWTHPATEEATALDVRVT